MPRILVRTGRENRRPAAHRDVVPCRPAAVGRVPRRNRRWLVDDRAARRQSAPRTLPNLARWAGGPPQQTATNEQRANRKPIGATKMNSRVQPNPVGRDVQNVVSEAQELLKTVKDEGANQMDAMK